MKTHLIGILALLCAASASAADTLIIKNGTTDWTQPGSYKENKVPQAGDKVRVDSDCTVTVRDEDSLAIVSRLSFINLYGENKSTIIFDVPAGKTWDVAPYVRQPSVDYAAGGNIVKKGAGTLQFLHTEDKAYAANITVEAGTLCLPTNVSSTTAYVGVLAISNGATVYMPETAVKGNRQLYILGLEGSGDLVNNSSTSVALNLSGKGAAWVWDGATHTFSGRIRGAASWTKMKGRQFLTGTDSQLSEFALNYDDGTGSSGAGTFGVSKIGTVGGTSPIGGTSFIRWIGGGSLLYLGTGETSDKELQFQEGGHPLIDGGEHGGLVFSGAVNGNIDKTHGAFDKTLTLDGINGDAPCALLGTLGSWAYSGVSYTFNLIKRGIGAWRLGSAASTMTGPVTVENGTLIVETITEKRLTSSIGTSMGQDAATCALSLGSDGQEGCLELYESSTENLFSPNRPIVLKGNARFKNSSAKSFRISDISLDGTGAKTLTLDGSGTESYVADLTNGTGRLSLVKEGSGTWHIGGKLEIADTLAVKQGTLVLLNPTNYTHYRWVIRGMASDEGSFTVIRPSNFGLFDADDKRINAGLTGVASLDKLTPGTHAFDATGPTSLTKTDPDRLFTNDSWPSAFYPYLNGTLTKPVVGDPDTWLSLTMYLSVGQPLARTWDYSCGDSVNPTTLIKFVGACALYGSPDGLHYDLLAEKAQTTYKEVYRAWAATGEQPTQANCETHPGGFATTYPEVATLNLAATVSVTNGATLRADRPVEIAKLEVFDTGFGTLDGVTLAANGELHLAGELAKGEMTLPGTFRNVENLQNLKGWQLIAGGKASDRKLVVTASGITIKQKGFVLILR